MILDVVDEVNISKELVVLEGAEKDVEGLPRVGAASKALKKSLLVDVGGGDLTATGTGGASKKSKEDVS